LIEAPDEAEVIVKERYRRARLSLRGQREIGT
jgi:hypothetical protein